MAQNPYIPPRDADFNNWFDNFSTRITATPALFGLTAGDAVQIAAAFTSWNDAYVAAITPSTRTPLAVAAKNNERAAAEAVIRPYAINVRDNEGVTDADKLDLGLNVPDTTPTPIPAPSSSPVITIVGATPLQTTLRVADETTPNVRKKPFGAITCELWRTVAATENPDPTAATFVGDFSRVPFPVDNEVGQAGLVATYFARWKTARGLVGPWSIAASFTIPGT